MIFDVPLTLGILGMALILVGFFMIQTHRLSQDDLRYDIINFAAPLSSSTTESWVTHGRSSS